MGNKLVTGRTIQGDRIVMFAERCPMDPDFAAGCLLENAGKDG